MTYLQLHRNVTSMYQSVINVPRACHKLFDRNMTHPATKHGNGVLLPYAHRNSSMAIDNVRCVADMHDLEHGFGCAEMKVHIHGRAIVHNIMTLRW